MDHLLVGCVFSKEVWYKVLQVLRLVDSFCEWWLQARKRVPKVRRRGFDALVLLVGRMIWKERNCRTLRAETWLKVLFADLLREKNTICGDPRRGVAVGSCWI
jgi:hypothetical protein